MTLEARWSALFWASLASLIGMSWLTARSGVPMWQVLNVGLVGMIAACGFAFLAMWKVSERKWPALAALLCTAPMALQLMPIWSFIGEVVSHVGVSAILLLAGSLATVAISIAILLAPLPRRAAPPPVAPARIVNDD